MLQSIVHGALKHRLILVVVAIALVIFGTHAAQHLSVDAFPTSPMFRFRLLPKLPASPLKKLNALLLFSIEISGDGPSQKDGYAILIGKPGLSLITLAFEDGRSLYLERQGCFNAGTELRDRMPEGVTPVLGPITNDFGEVYQYTLERPNDGKRPLTREELIERRTIQDWVVRPLSRSIPGVAEINSTGGHAGQHGDAGTSRSSATITRLSRRPWAFPAPWPKKTLTPVEVSSPNMLNNTSSVLVSSIRDLDDIRGIVLKESGGTPVYIRDVADVRLGTAVRYGAMIKNGYTESTGWCRSDDGQAETPKRLSVA